MIRGGWQLVLVFSVGCSSVRVDADGSLPDDAVFAYEPSVSRGAGSIVRALQAAGLEFRDLARASHVVRAQLGRERRGSQDSIDRRSMGSESNPQAHRNGRSNFNFDWGGVADAAWRAEAGASRLPEPEPILTIEIFERDSGRVVWTAVARVNGSIGEGGGALDRWIRRAAKALVQELR